MTLFRHYDITKESTGIVKRSSFHHILDSLSNSKRHSLRFYPFLPYALSSAYRILDKEAHQFGHFAPSFELVFRLTRLQKSLLPP